MSVPIRCPHCKTVMQAADTSIGQKVLCPKCRNVLVVPAPARPAPAPAPTARPPAPAPPARPPSPPVARQPAPAAPPPRPASPPPSTARPPAPVAPTARRVVPPPVAPKPAAPLARQVTTPPAPLDRRADTGPLAAVAAPSQPRRGRSALQGPLPWIIAGGVGVAVLLGVTVLWAASALFSSKPPATQPDNAQASAPAPKDSPEDTRGGDKPGPSHDKEEKGKETTPEIPPLPGKDGDRGEPGPPVPPPPADDPSAGAIPLFSVRLASLQRLLSDLRQLMATFGKEKELDGMVLQMTKAISVEGALGVDTAKPWGAYVRVNDRGDLGGVVVVLPVRTETGFRRLLKDMGLQEGPPVGELTPLRLPPQGLAPGMVPPGVKLQLPEQIYMRLAGGHAHLCVAGDPNMLVGDRLVSAATLFRSGRDRLLSATLRLDQMPRPLQEKLAAGLSLSRQQLVLPKGAPPEAEKLVRAWTDLVETTIKEVHSLTLDVDLDRKGDRLNADLYLRGRKGSGLATALTEAGSSTSLFGDLVRQDVPFAVLVNVGLPRSLRPLLPGLITDVTRTTLRDASEEDRRKHEPLFRAVADVFAAGELDTAVVVRSRGEGQPATVVGGLKVPNGPALDRVFRDGVAQLDDKATRDLFDLDADTLEGVKVHRFRAQATFNPSLRGAFGDNPFFYAFRSDALLFTAGVEGKEALGRALALRPTAAPLALVKMNLYQLNQLMPLQPQDAPLARKLLSDTQPGRMRLELTSGEALRLHLGLDLAVLRFVAAHADALPVQIKTEPR